MPLSRSRVLFIMNSISNFFALLVIAVSLVDIVVRLSVLFLSKNVSAYALCELRGLIAHVAPFDARSAALSVSNMI
jgi:hypothetical protein